MREKGSSKSYGHHPKTMNNLVWGRNPVLEWLESGLSVKELFLSRDAGGRVIADIIKRAEHKKISLKRLHPAKLDELAGTEKHQGLCAKVGFFPVNDFEVITKNTATRALWVLLDQIVDPQNLGAIIRTCVCFNINGMILPKNRSSALSPAVSKASAGALEHANIIRITNIVQGIKELKEIGYWIIGLDKNGMHSVGTFKFPDRTALVIGAEEKGIRRLEPPIFPDL